MCGSGAATRYGVSMPVYKAWDVYSLVYTDGYLGDPKGGSNETNCNRRRAGRRFAPSRNLVLTS